MFLMLFCTNLDVCEYIKLIRERSGMPPLPTGLTKDEMRERIRHERRIELAFETHWYFDCLRWKIAKDAFGGDIIGLDVNTDSYSMNSLNFYKRQKVESQVFEDKHYLWPIPQVEYEKSPGLGQNPSGN